MILLVMTAFAFIAWVAICYIVTDEDESSNFYKKLYICIAVIILWTVLLFMSSYFGWCL